MKTLYRFIIAGIICMSPVSAGEPKSSPKLDVLAMRTIPDGRYSLTLELKQLDGEAAKVELDAKDGRLASSDDSGRLGNIQGKTHFIGNGVFMVQLQGKGYVATQFWVFKSDGSATIKEIPDRGEAQTAVPVGR